MRPYGRNAQWALQRAGIAAHCFVIPPGETSKSFQLAQEIYEWLVGLKAERGQPIIAIGGGVSGDLGGFIASTFLRGVPFVQVPTSMAAMVDASIGGKVAVNLPQAKNMVGAFYQPRAVLADVGALSTLGKRELAEGWAEAIKHGLILDPSTSAKTLGIRILLNYGHTIGHALEASTEYGRFMHGEGVSVGMMGAARIAREMGMIGDDIVERQRTLLQRFNLPITAPDVDLAAVRSAMSLDKKTVGGANRWVLLEDVGQATVRRDIPTELVDDTLAWLTR
ncbi:3-dehydroquinate synthase [Geodia barretti]|uniref:3-dehydroquinate synthase n=1 Tax=Geodia barretti TaxID=519541 RepID=A0AA35TP08_GEOBA|nr:3-dehydroquinate synthase [Geodia barretti]